MTAAHDLASPLLTHNRPSYSVSLAKDEAEVRAAQLLRHQVFAGEMGAVLDTPVPGLDIDALDAYCDHLLVTDDSTGLVVGTYRLLSPANARRAGRTYSESEFDLGRLAGIRDDVVEVGRSCVHPAHRDGAVINLMWAGIARYLHLTGRRWLAGCASVGLADGGQTAAGVWDLVLRKHLSPPQRRVLPLRPWQPVERAGRLQVPPLLRGYLRLGAEVCGAPAYDPDFNCADFYVLFSMDRLDPRYRRHFLGAAR